jgi:hypothetical protein
MNPTAHDFVTVDMRGLKAALVVRAQTQRTSVSALVRTAVARELGVPEVAPLRSAAMPAPTLRHPKPVKLSIRLAPTEADRFAAAARVAGLSRGAHLAGLIAGVPVLIHGVSRRELLAALVASNGELSTLGRDLRHLTSLLRRGSIQAAREYRQTLDDVADDVHGHLRLAAGVLAELRPRSHRGDTSNPPAT